MHHCKLNPTSQKFSYVPLYKQAGISYRHFTASWSLWIQSCYGAMIHLKYAMISFKCIHHKQEYMYLQLIRNVVATYS